MAFFERDFGVLETRRVDSGQKFVEEITGTSQFEVGKSGKDNAFHGHRDLGYVTLAVRGGKGTE